MRQIFLIAVALTCFLEAQTDVSRALLAAHNKVRAGVGVRPLEWSAPLAAVAQQWADEMAASGKFAHRPKGRYGENIFEIQGAKADAAEVVSDWAGEVKDYNAASNSCSSGKVCGHYTQVVWRGTLRVGCGVARRGSREVWVCNYDPPGNWAGERPY